MGMDSEFLFATVSPKSDVTLFVDQNNVHINISDDGVSC